jgi:GNAT superfamily N-acetyltransferase
MHAHIQAPVEAFTADHPLWTHYLAHLERAGQTRDALNGTGNARPDCHYLGLVHDGDVIGNLVIRMQPIIVPATPWSGDMETALTGPDGQGLQEMFVQTFAVDPQHQRRGYGRALQLAALALARERGCYQLRSWSSLDRRANYVLKLTLGFAAHPAVSVTDRGQQVSGVYFVKTV